MTAETKKPNKPSGGFSALRSSIHFLNKEGLIKGAKTLLKANQVTGFDCPGCAWPDPDPQHRSIAEFCENGVKAISFETTKKRASRELFQQKTVSELNQMDVCTLTNQGRLTEPFLYDRPSDQYHPISWEKAFKKIGSHLRSLSSPDDAIFYTSGRTSNEAAFLYQLMGRILGTNNFPDCSNLCHESSGVGMSESIGIGKGTVSLDDFEKAELIIIFGQNPGTNHPRMLSVLQRAARRGAKIVSINPLKEVGLVSFIHPQEVVPMILGQSTPISTHYYSIKMGSDMALVRAVVRYIMEHHSHLIDQDFIDQHTSGFKSYQKKVLQEDWNQLVKASSLSQKEVIEIAELYLKSERTICCWAMGLTQHQHGVYNIQEIVNLLLLKGQLGREGAGACPVRGHSNVQGDRTVGITESPKEAFLKKIESTFNFRAPRKHGFNVVKAIKAMDEKPGKVFIALGGNFAAAAPDTYLTYQALRKCALTVHISTHLNKSHLICGEEALILPCIGRTEMDLQNNKLQSVTVEDSMSMVHASKGRNRPASNQLKSEPAIIAGIARASLPDDCSVDFDQLTQDYDKIREKIEAVLPAFSGYNEKIQQGGGFHLYHSARARKWETSDQKAHFIFNPLPKLEIPPGHLALMTIRSHDQFNTTVYANNDRYRGIKNNRKVILLNPLDMEHHELKEGDQVHITSHAQDHVKREVKSFTVVPYDIKLGCAATYFPEANPLVSINDFADKSNTPAYKFIDVTLEKVIN